MSEKIILELDVDSTGAVKSLNKVEGGVKDVGVASKKSAKGVGVLKKGLNALNAAAGIITLIVGAVLLLKKAFTSSEEGQNRYNKAMAVLESIFNNIMDVLADLSEDIVSLFENPQQALKDFANLIKDNIVNRFEGLLELLPQLGKAINLLFEGEFSAAAEVAANAAAKVTLGVDDIVGKTREAIAATSDFIDEIVREADVAAGISDMRALADKKERELIVQRAEANRQIAELREKAADKENVSTEERIRLLTEAGLIAEEITRKEQYAATLRLQAIQAENELSNSNKEALDAEAQAQARVIELETERLRQQKALTAELTTTRREAEAEQRAIDNALHQEELARIKEKEEAEKAAAKITADLLAKEIAAEKAAAAQKLQIDKLTAEAKISTATAVLGAVSSIAAEGSALAKGAAIAQTVIDTYKSATGAFSSLAPIPVVGPALGALAAAAAVVAGIANVKKIVAVKPGKGSASGVSTPAVPKAVNISSVAAPDFSINGDDGQSQLADTVQNANTTPTRAYVVNSDIKDAQEFDRQTENGATF